jgi:hypothetical protein
MIAQLVAQAQAQAQRGRGPTSKKTEKDASQVLVDRHGHFSWWYRFQKLAGLFYEHVST